MNLGKNKYKSINDAIEHMLLALMVCGSIGIGAWMLFYARYGFDITDEGMYLNAISRPSSYNQSFTHFGYIYHVIYLMASGDITFLRQINLLLVYGLSWALMYYLLKPIDTNYHRLTSVWLAISSAFATIGYLTVIIVGTWLPTPSYNTLSIEASILTALGLVWVYKDNPNQVRGWIAIGVGGWLAFMAKPTTALALGLIMVCGLSLAPKLRLKRSFFLLLGVIVLFWCSSLLIDGSPAQTLNRLNNNLKLMEYLNSGHSFYSAIRLEDLTLSYREKEWLTRLTLGLFGILLLISSQSLILKAFSIVMLGLATIGGAAIILSASTLEINIGIMQELLIWSIPFASTLYAVFIFRHKVIFSIPFYNWLLSAIFIIMPYAYVFGTNNSYWVAVGPASIFWVAAGLTIACCAAQRQKSWLGLAVIALAAQLFVILRVHHGLENPYRQKPPIFYADYRLNLPVTKSSVIVHAEYGEYLYAAFKSMDEAGLKKNTPVIDLTGQSPGLLYAVGAKSVAQAWLIGGYPGSAEFAEKSLAAVSCEELVRAWILFEPSGPRSIPESVLRIFGAELGRDFKLVASWYTTPGVGGYAEVREQQLLKPIRSVETATSVCGTQKTTK